mgnify:CR=1 FL=1
MRIPNESRCAKSATVACAFLLAVIGAKADMIVLDDGSEYRGELLRGDSTSVEFRVDGNVETYPRESVVHIRLQKKRDWAEAKTVEDIDDPLLHAALGVPFAELRQTGAGALVLHDSRTVELKGPQTWTKSRRQIIRVLNEHGKRESIRSLRFHKHGETARILHGLSVRPSGEVVHLRDTAVQTEHPYHHVPRYDTLTELRFALPEGKPGTLLDISTRTDRKQAVFGRMYADSFRMGGVDPMRDIQVTITAPKGLALHWQVLNDPDESVSHETTRTGATVRHRWTRESSPRLTPEPRMPPLADVIPRVVVSAGWQDWQQLALHIEQKMAVLRRQKDLPSSPDRIEATPQKLWEWISANIAEDAVPVAATGYRPGDAAKTMTLRQGAPLDRTFLLFAWLRAAGKPAKWCWLRPRSAGALATDVPSLGQFTVPAVAVGERDERRFLVLGDELAAFGEPAARLGGAACILAGEGLTTLPVPEPLWRGTDRIVKVTLDEDGNAAVLDTVVARGPAARTYRQWRRKTPKEILHEVTGRVRSEVPTATDIGWSSEADFELNATAVSITRRYNVAALAHVNDAVASLRPPWLDYRATVVGRPSRQFDLFWNAPHRQTVHIEVAAPETMRWEFVPESVERLVDEYARLKTTSHAEGPRADYTVVYERSGQRIPADSYPALQECLRTRAKAGEKYWIGRP